MKTIIAFAAIALLAGCGAQPDSGNTTINMTATDADMTGADIVDVPDGEGGTAEAEPMVAWVGRWTGVEGTYLDIAADDEVGPGHYRLTMQYGLDPDMKGTYKGVAEGEAIVFTRADGDHTLKASDGDATGLKYLAGKQDCLVVASGEGYCRD